MKHLIAHSSPDGLKRPQMLHKHLTAVAEIARDCFSLPFMRDAAYALGQYHDAGKASETVQYHIMYNTKDKPDHSTYGGQRLTEHAHKALKYLAAAPILGHHGGLPNCVGKSERGRSVEARLANVIEDDIGSAFEAEMQDSLVDFPLPSGMPICSRVTGKMESYLMAKMLHSALVDADRLDSEAFTQPDKANNRSRYPMLMDLLPRYDQYMSGFPIREMIDEIRADIRRDCLQAAEQPQGVFSLTVPTGGGKTLSSLGFALYHAAKWKNIRRVIYAIPFTSIVEQNAKVFREALGDEAVLEHHSTVLPPEEGSPADLATENWDAPIIVTTNVQLFESLFSNRPSSCRKLHRLQDSVIILDEVQALPDGYLQPCINILDALVKDYHTTVVMCSATQPAFDEIWQEKPSITEMMNDPKTIAEKLRRTKMELAGKLNDIELHERLITHEQVLCIVNNRAHAQKMHALLGGETEGAYHLSTLMCPQHRTEKLNIIRHRLRNGERCRLISTSLIEAGVDIDFPIVYRAFAGLDSIVQAAGRCNRNGKQTQLAMVYVFTPADHKAPTETERLAKITRDEIMPHYSDLLGDEAMRTYFGLRYGPGKSLDKAAILKDILACDKIDYPYAGIAERFRMIDSKGETVFIPYNTDAVEALDELRNVGPNRTLLRRLQRFGITLYPAQIIDMSNKGFLQEIEGIRFIDVPGAQYQQIYDQAYGLNTVAQLTALVL